MLKNILNLDGAQQLSKNEQKEINGGVPEGCAYQTWGLGGPATIPLCQSSNPEGYNYHVVNGTFCRAYFCETDQI